MKTKRTSAGWAGWLGAIHGKQRCDNPERAGTYAAQDWYEGWDDFMTLSEMEQRMQDPAAYDRRMRPVENR